MRNAGRLALAVFLLAGTNSARAGEEVSSRAWADAEANLCNAAYAKFREAGKGGGKQRENAFGEAIALLGMQPRTEQNITRAEQLMEEIASDKTGGPLSLLARFFQGRIEQVHVSPANPHRAASLYREVLEARSGHPVVESAAAKLVTMVVSGKSGAALREALVASEPLAELLSSREGRREFHFEMGLGYLEAGEFSQGIAHLRLADEQGFARNTEEIRAWLAIAEAARLLGDKTLALRYYDAYLAKYQRDARRQIVEQRVSLLRAIAP